LILFCRDVCHARHYRFIFIIVTAQIEPDKLESQTS